MAMTDLLPPWLRICMQAGGAALIILAGPAFYAVTRDGAGASIVLAAGAAALLLSRIDMIEQFAAWGLSAKLREAKAAVEQATVTAEELRRMALALTRISLGHAKGGGRFGGHEAIRKSTAEQAERVFQAISASPEERRLAYLDWTAWVLIDLAADVFRAIEEAATPDKRAELAQLRDQYIDSNA